MQKIVVGILGTGRIGKIHIKNLWNHPQIHIKGIADPYVDRTFIEALKLPLYNNVEEIFLDKEIDAVFICTPSNTHYNLIKQALVAKKAIFCEKPVDLDLKRILEIRDLIQISDGFLQVGFNRRFDSNFRGIAKLIKEGEVGKLLQLRITSRDFSPPPRSYVESSGGMFLDMSIHDFDMLCFLSQSKVKEVFVMGKSMVSDYGDIDIDTATIQLVLENDCLAVIENCRQAVYGYDQRVEAFGDKGRVFCENKYDNSITLCNALAQSHQNPLDFFLERYADSYKQELDDFIEHFSSSKKPSVGIEESIQSTLIALCALESLKTKSLVSMDFIKQQYQL